MPATVYPKAGIFQAPDWRNPLTGAVTGAHSLKTGDRTIAIERWEIEKANAILSAKSGGRGAMVAQRAFNPMVAGSSPAAPTLRVSLSAAIAADLARRAPAIKPATLASYQGHAREVVRRMGDVWIDTLDTPALADYCARETARLGRTHTVVKRLESIVKPALRYAAELGQIPRLPMWPKIRSDFRAKGKRRAFLSREQYAALRAALPEQDILDRGDGRKLIVYPRTWLDLAVTTGMHDADINRFAGADYDATRRLWFRRNTKRDEIYEPEWLPVDALMFECMKARKPGPGRLFVAELDAGHESELPAQWMRRRLIWAAQRSGIAKVVVVGRRKLPGGRRAGGKVRVEAGRVPSPNDLRRTFATWRHEDGWEFAETARWLANSSGMVREVYAQMPPRAMVRAVGRSAGPTAKLLKLTRDLEAARRPARSAAPVSARSESRSNINPQPELTHGKQTVQGGGTTD